MSACYIHAVPTSRVLLLERGVVHTSGMRDAIRVLFFTRTEPEPKVIKHYTLIFWHIGSPKGAEIA